VALATMLALFTFRAEVNAAAHVVGSFLQTAWVHVSSAVRPEPRGEPFFPAWRPNPPLSGDARPFDGPISTIHRIALLLAADGS
jgi:hypothetical protein